MTFLTKFVHSSNKSLTDNEILEGTLNYALILTVDTEKELSWNCLLFC